LSLLALGLQKLFSRKDPDGFPPGVDATASHS